MRRPYRDELKRLAELEKQFAPVRMVTVELPDGTERKMKPSEFWPRRTEFVERDERGVWHYKAWMEGYSAELFTLLIMEAEPVKIEDETRRRALYTLLTLFFGKAAAKQIMEGEQPCQ